jgi:hypothetical protein
VIAEANGISHPNWIDYQRLKASLAKFCGWSARDSRLRTSTAYEVVSSRLLEVLGL